MAHAAKSRTFESGSMGIPADKEDRCARALLQPLNAATRERKRDSGRRLSLSLSRSRLWRHELLSVWCREPVVCASAAEREKDTLFPLAASAKIPRPIAQQWKTSVANSGSTPTRQQVFFQPNSRAGRGSFFPLALQPLEQLFPVIIGADVASWTCVC